MRTHKLPTLFIGLSMGIIGCGGSESDSSNSDGTGGAAATGGAASGGAASGGAGTGGLASGGAPSGGAPSGGAPSGGAPSGGAPSGGGPSGGAPSGGNGGMDGTGGDGTGGDAGGSAAVPSSGCGDTNGPMTVTSGGQSVQGGLSTSTRLTINAGSSSGEYIIDIPDDYDPNTPYRLIFSWHQAYGSANGNAVGQYPANNGPNFDADNYAYFGLHRAAEDAGDSAIFIAPQGIGNFPWDYDRDVVLFDELLAFVGENLCIDESRVFTTGFSFGAMMSHALSLGRADKLRGAVTMAPANYNFTQPTDGPDKIAYFSITGMSDGTCPWVNNDGNQTGGKYCSITHADENGCTVPVDIPTVSGGNDHLCYDYEDCDEGYPVKVCTFDGGHTPSSVSDGSPGDDGLNAFVPPLAWEFISQL